MNSIWTFQGRVIEPTPEEIQACLKGVIEESEREERVLTHDEIEDARGLLELLSETLAKDAPVWWKNRI
jgi:hypothetical protein